MSGHDCDIAVVGGGLAGGLIALALVRARPELAVRVLEAGAAPGGNHRWSWFESDLSRSGRALLDGFCPTRWDHGYEVFFPKFARTLRTPYRSLSSSEFAAGLEQALPAGTIRTGAAAAVLDRDGVTLASGERLAARAVIDCRGFEPTPHLAGGWQVFMGRHVRAAAPHGVERPIIMDAEVDQLGGFRFVYVLPLSADEIFVEDTYYQDRPELDRLALGRRSRPRPTCRATGSPPCSRPAPVGIGPRRGSTAASARCCSAPRPGSAARCSRGSTASTRA